jgi:hypothetical protein
LGRACVSSTSSQASLPLRACTHIFSFSIISGHTLGANVQSGHME